MRVSKIGVVASAAILGLSLGSCGGSDDGGSDNGGSTGDDTNAVETPLFPDDFEPVCQGATVSKATPYDEAADKDCPSLVMFDEGEQSVDQYASVPKEKVVALLRPFVQP